MWTKMHKSADVYKLEKRKSTCLAYYMYAYMNMFFLLL